MYELVIKHEANTCLVPSNACPAFGARTFSTIIMTAIALLLPFTIYQFQSSKILKEKYT
jgi:hypothetical protein